MKEKDRRIAQELKKRLSEVVEVLDFKVFGSGARGDADEYSDLDVFRKVNSIDLTPAMYDPTTKRLF